MDRGTRKDTSSPRCGDLLAFKYATFSMHTTGVPRLVIAAARSKGGLRSRRVGSVLPTGMSRVTSRTSQRQSLLGNMSVSPGLLPLCCTALLHPSGGVGAGRKAHHSSSFSCVTMDRIWACRCVASFCVLRLNVTRGRLKSITVKVSNPNRAFLRTSEKIQIPPDFVVKYQALDIIGVIHSPTW
jgi:hypothetical protein